MGVARSKSRSPGQILENSCLYSKGNILGPTFIKLGQSVSLDDMTPLKMGVVRSICRSIGQILQKSCLHSKGHIFGPIYLKLNQSVCLDDVMNPFENDCGCGRVKQ